ncbi:hypothetical protein L209DRAFT_471164 [Thermothelomyces heterothallicus CBS 203.75]
MLSPIVSNNSGVRKFHIGIEASIIASSLAPAAIVLSGQFALSSDDQRVWRLQTQTESSDLRNCSLTISLGWMAREPEQLLERSTISNPNSQTSVQIQLHPSGHTCRQLSPPHYQIRI